MCLFENVECQWPLFYCFLVINGCFSGSDDDVRRFSKALDRCIVWRGGSPLVPELYAFPKEGGGVGGNPSDVANGNAPMASGKETITLLAHLYFLSHIVVMGCWGNLNVYQ